jgi:hypothetical protein
MRLSTCKSVLFFVFGFVLAGLSVSSFASTYATVGLKGYTSSGGASYYTPLNEAQYNSVSRLLDSSGGLGGYQVMSDYNVARASGAVANLRIPVNAAVDLSRVGSAATAFLKHASPIGTAVALVDLVCTLTDICNSGGSFVKSGYPYTSTLDMEITGSSVSDYCSQVPPSITGGHSLVQAPGTIFCAWADNPGVQYSNNPVTRGATPVVAPVTSQDWDNAAPQLNTPQVASQLDSAGQPVPVQTPTVSPAESAPSVTSSTDTDSSGNPTMQKTSSSTIHADPAPTTADPLQIKTTEVITTTTTNLTNNTTTTNITNIDTPPPNKPTTQDDVTFDSVDDVDLPKQDLNPSFSYSSWGEGTCPADPSVSYLGHSMTIPFHVVCTAAGYIRPIVLLLGLLISGYIISGVRKAT